MPAAGRISGVTLIWLQRYDLILDNVASRAFSDLRRTLTPQGKIVPNSGHAYLLKSRGLFYNVGMPAPILATKLYIPPPRPRVVHRARLIDRLQAGLQRMPGVILISASAGFGKTTLVSDWLWETMNEERGTITEDESPHRSSFPVPSSSFLTPRFKVAWLTLDKDDNDLPRFLAYVIAALQTIAPTVGEATLAALHASRSQPPTDVLLTALLNDLAALGDAVLVLDDYHAIDCPPIDEALTFLVEHLPPQFRLVIATREDPPLPLARLRAQGRLTELRATDLRFTPDEAAAFLNQAMGLHLSASDIAALEARTEGWIAGLQLAALSLQGRVDSAAFVEAFTGSHRFVLDYLMEEVLQRQPEPVRRFLLQTSILNRLCGSLCDAVNESAGGRSVLEMLERGNLFVVPLDDSRQWFRYHHLFADVLAARLIDEQAAGVSELHRRASAWFEQNDLPAEAIQHALLAQDVERAANLIERVWLGMDLSYQSAAWLRWAQQLPDDVIRAHPVLCLGYAWALLNGGEMEACESWLRDAERWIDPTPEAASQMAVVDEAEYRALPAAIASARAYRASALGDIPGTIRHARQALALAAEDDVVRRTQATALLGLAEYANGDLPAAERSLLAFQATALQGGDMATALGITFILADIWRALGWLRKAISAYRQALHLAAKQAALPIGASDLYRGLSELLCEQGDLAAAAEYLATAQKVGELTELTGWPHRLGVAQARLKEAQGDLEAALALLDEAERLSIREALPDVRPIAALKGRVWIRQGRWREADRWAEEQGLSPDDELSYLREFEHLTLARVLIARYRSDRDEESIRDALGLLERLWHVAQDGGRSGSMIEILLLQALARRAQGDAPAAIALLERALTLAEPEGYVRLFVDEGEEMQLLMAECRVLIERQKHGDRHKLMEYMNQLLAAFPPATMVQEETRGQKSEIRSQKSEWVEPLSERELDVLKLLDTELSGPEIAGRLSVSLNTVRTHTKNIYGKLGVNSRRAAVRRAEELGLL
jgi:LuxR family transcriptional regulator, maltose regulon positive regulatory protein